MHRVQQRQPLNNMCDLFKEAVYGCLFELCIGYLERHNEGNYKILEQAKQKCLSISGTVGDSAAAV